MDESTVAEVLERTRRAVLAVHAERPLPALSAVWELFSSGRLRGLPRSSRRRSASLMIHPQPALCIAA